MFNTIDINRIKNTNSRKNFELVLQSYYSANYKASILLLYNLIINDLYSKLLLMNDNNYVSCQEELDYIENTLKDGDETKYSIVEEKIFNTYKDKKILNHSTIDLLDYFKKVRNKCAHPFFFKENEYSPLPEEVYLFMLKFFNEILIVEAFFKDPYKAMEEDIENYDFPPLSRVLVSSSSLSKDADKVKGYFEIKYFKYMTDNNFKKLFKTLMDLTIYKNSDEIQKHQYQHMLILVAMLEYLKAIGKIEILNNEYNWSKLKAEVLYNDANSDIFSNEWFALNYIYKILSYNNNFLKELGSSNEIVYDKVQTELYKSANLFINSWDLFDFDINEAIEKFNTNLGMYNYYHIIASLYKKIDRNKLLKLIKMMLNKVPGFDGYSMASDSLELFIIVLSSIEPKYEQEEIEEIFEIINGNRQFFDRSRNDRDSQLVRITNLGYDLSNYIFLKT